MRKKKGIIIAVVATLSLNACAADKFPEYKNGDLDGKPISCRVDIDISNDTDDYVQAISCTEGTLP